MENQHLVDLIKKRKPLIHHITNYVTANDCANITLALGGRPIMAPYEGEAEEITGAASSLLLNIGTLMPQTYEAMLRAGRHATEIKIPVILDPVGCGASGFRSDAARQLIDKVKPDIIKGNAAEIKHLLFLSDMSGVDSDDIGDPLPAAKTLAIQNNTTVMVTGAIDIITDGTRTAKVKNGTSMMSMITGTGCMLGSITSCFAAVSRDMYISCQAAAALMGICGQRASDTLTACEGTGTFRQRFIDAVYLINDDDIDKEAIIEYI